MDLFLYLDRDTPIHRLDPRTKILLTLLSFAMALMFRDIPVLLVVTALVLLVGSLGRALPNLGRIRGVLIMIALFCLTIWPLARGELSLSGVLYGAMVALKTDLMIVAGMVFLSTTKIEEIAEGLVRLHLPYRGAFAFATAIRLVPMIVETSHTIIQAQKSRGLDLDSGNFLERIRRHVPLVIPTLVSLIRSTNVFSMALESKGFGYSLKRTTLLDLRLGRGDCAAIVLGLGVFAALLVLKLAPGAYAAWAAFFPWGSF